MKDYRTFLAALAAMALLTWCALRGVHGEDLQTVKWGLVGIVTMVAGRSVARAAAGGGGLAGIASVLTTSAKPEPEAK